VEFVKTTLLYTSLSIANTIGGVVSLILDGIRWRRVDILVLWGRNLRYPLKKQVSEPEGKSILPLPGIEAWV
jgi:hypothetical protein